MSQAILLIDVWIKDFHLQFAKPAPQLSNNCFWHVGMIYSDDPSDINVDPIDVLSVLSDKFGNVTVGFELEMDDVDYESFVISDYLQHDWKLINKWPC